MSERREVELPSGAVLRIQVAPFVASKNLYQAVLREIKDVSITANMQVHQLLKDAFCAGFSSLEIEKCFWECAKSCTYERPGVHGEIRVSPQTFEAVEARDDYMVVCVEVARDNIGPFTKSLYANFNTAMEFVEAQGKSQKQ